MRVATELGFRKAVHVAANIVVMVPFAAVVMFTLIMPLCSLMSGDALACHEEQSLRIWAFVAFAIAVCAVGICAVWLAWWLGDNKARICEMEERVASKDGTFSNREVV